MSITLWISGYLGNFFFVLNNCKPIFRKNTINLTIWI